MEHLNISNIETNRIYYHLLYGNLAENTGKLNLTISDAFRNKLFDISSRYISKINDSVDQLTPYNQIGSNDGDIEYLILSEEPYDTYFSPSWFDNIETLHTNNDDGIEDFNYFIIETFINNEVIYLFRKPQKPKVVKKKFILRKVGQEYIIDDSNLIIFDEDIDFIIYQDKMYIFRHNAVDSAFNMLSLYRDKAKEILSSDVIKEKVINYEQLIEDVDGNISFMKRVSKLERAEHKFLFLENLSTTKEINERFDLGLNISDDKINYEDKSQASHLIAFMQDAYYTTLLGEKIGTDLRR